MINPVSLQPDLSFFGMFLEFKINAFNLGHKNYKT
jgi:hypothetical protein